MLLVYVCVSVRGMQGGVRGLCCSVCSVPSIEKEIYAANQGTTTAKGA